LLEVQRVRGRGGEIREEETVGDKENMVMGDRRGENCTRGMFNVIRRDEIQTEEIITDFFLIFSFLFQLKEIQDN